MGHVAKHSAGAGSNRDRSAPPSKPGEPAETPAAEPVAVKPGEPGDRPDDPAGSVVVEPLDSGRSAADDRTVVRPTMPGRGTRRWWQFGRGDEGPRPVSHAAGAKPRPTPDPARSTDRSPLAGGISRGVERSVADGGLSRAADRSISEDRNGRGVDRSTWEDRRIRAGERFASDRGSSPGVSRRRNQPSHWDAGGDRVEVGRHGTDAASRDHRRAESGAASASGQLFGASRPGADVSARDRSSGEEPFSLRPSGWDGAEQVRGAVLDAAAADDGDRVKLEEGRRSSLRPSAPTGTPTYEGMGTEDTAVLPRLGDPLQTARIWTSRPEPAPEKDDEKAKKVDVTSLTDVGIKLLPEIEPGAPDGPVTNARWAALVRSATRRMIWTLPAAGVIAGAASIGAMVRGGPAYYLNGAEPFRLIMWVTSVWFGMIAMICLVGILAAVRVRATALTGLMLGLLGGISMLMFAAVPPATPIWGLSAKTLTLSCGALYSAGWVAMGWAVFRSRMFSRGDGLMLMLCGPMIGFAGLWLSPFHTAGALLMIAAGLGIAWKSGSTLRAVRAGRAADLAAQAGPPLELAEIRPRRVRKPKPPKPPKARKQPKPSKRSARGKQTDPKRGDHAGATETRQPHQDRHADRPGTQDRHAAQDRHGAQDPHGARDRHGAQDRNAAQDRHGAHDGHGARDRNTAQDRNAGLDRHAARDPHPAQERPASLDYQAGGRRGAPQGGYAGQDRWADRNADHSAWSNRDTGQERDADRAADQGSGANRHADRDRRADRSADRRGWFGRNANRHRDADRDPGQHGRSNRDADQRAWSDRDAGRADRGANESARGGRAARPDEPTVDPKVAAGQAAPAGNPAKDEKPSRRPGKRRLRLGATTRETTPSPATPAPPASPKESTPEEERRRWGRPGADDRKR
ncbi:hypothetical protein O7635_33140 [Asanoa sp. WMMD1127]|uniref:hypothetical protein n=1 Tax=Asanoa sp. WMMD1127 TaxID=3016107 RepID=UPI002416D6C5|nr:hypothetical protein [Asanoa sp. WMMD1127]MDG4826721.1 hypothetical protein [Asanoa sp. WMMD1127]